MSPLHGLASLKQTLKTAHIVFNRGFALTRIKQALFSLQNIIFRVALQYGWHGPWHKEWNGAFVPDSHKCHPTYPYWLVPAWPTHVPAHGPCSSCNTHADADGFAGSSCSLKKHIGMFLEVIRTIDPSSTTASYISTFRGWRSLLLFFPVSPILRVSVFQVFPFTLRTCFSADCHDSLSHSLHQQLSLEVIA